MKWKTQMNRVGETRQKRRFLLFPKNIGDETRWFEIATWEERYSATYADSGWDAINWINR